MNRALIIGGGVVGLTTALELRQRGLSVTLLEKSRVGTGASGAAGGILSPLQPWRSETAVAELCALSLSRYRCLLDEMQAQGETVKLIAAGLLCLMPQETRAARAWAEAREQRLVELDADALAREEPALAAATGFLLPDVCRVDPPTLLGALARTAERRGVQIRENCTAQTITVEKGRATGVETAAGFITADVIVVCTGAWLSSSLPDAFSRPNVRPVRGQIVEFAAEPGLLRHVVSHKAPDAEMEHYLIPRDDGHVLAGSTLERCGFDDSITDEAREALSQAAARVLPALTRYPVVRQWAGLRPDAARPTPLIGAHPEIAGLFINGGHYRNGIALAPGSALLAAQLVCEEATAMDATPFAITP